MPTEFDKKFRILAFIAVVAMSVSDPASAGKKVARIIGVRSLVSPRMPYFKIRGI